MEILTHIQTIMIIIRHINYHLIIGRLRRTTPATPGARTSAMGSCTTTTSAIRTMFAWLRLSKHVNA